jgi:glycosyltransferase involved in cell wall biosynthesis
MGAEAPRGRVRVYYGYRYLPAREQVAVGGLVKLQALARRFPNTRRSFSVLYLVSSCLPEGAVALARAAKRKQVRIVVNQNGVAYPGWYGRGWQGINVPMAELLHVADHVFYQSEFCRMAADEFLGGRPGPCEILYNPVDKTVFSPVGAPQERRTLTLIVGGSQDKSYRVTTAIDVLARVVRQRPDARLVVTGRLGWTRRFEQAKRMALEWAGARGVADRVDFTGPYSQAAAVEIFRQGSLLLHTKYNDPCPTVVLEAMACGLPVVYSATGGVPELVGSQAGLGVPGEVRWDREMPPDPEALASAVLTVAERHDQYSQAARQRASSARFGLRPWLQRHVEVFERLVA